MKPAILLLSFLAAAAPAAADPGAGADAAPWRSALRLGSPLDVPLAGLLVPALPDEGEDEPPGPDLGGMKETRAQEYEQGLYELRLSCWIWNAALDARTKASTKDMRLAQGLMNLQKFGASIHHVDVVEEMNIPESRIIINPEITLRLNNSALRASWWWFRETSEVEPTKVYAFGDVIYVKDPDGEAAWNRVPPDAVDPAWLTNLPKISFTAELMDTKLMYEARVNASASLEVYVGLAIHWLRYKATANTSDRVFTAYGDGSIHDREAVTEEEFGDYPLISMSLRVEYRPYGNYYFSLDAQEMYLYFGNYTDLKVAVWSQVVPYVRIGVGWRMWNVQVALYELGTSKHNIEVNALLNGIWAGLFIMI